MANAEYGVAALFVKRTAIRRNTHIFTGKAPQSKDCDALQDGTLSGIASKCGAHQGRRTVRCANQCRCSTFDAFFLMRTV